MSKLVKWLVSAVGVSAVCGGLVPFPSEKPQMTNISHTEFKKAKITKEFLFKIRDKPNLLTFNEISLCSFLKQGSLN